MEDFRSRAGGRKKAKGTKKPSRTSEEGPCEETRKQVAARLIALAFALGGCRDGRRCRPPWPATRAGQWRPCVSTPRLLARQYRSWRIRGRRRVRALEKATAPGRCTVEPRQRYERWPEGKTEAARSNARARATVCDTPADHPEQLLRQRAEHYGAAPRAGRNRSPSDVRSCSTKSSSTTSRRDRPSTRPRTRVSGRRSFMTATPRTGPGPFDASAMTSRRYLGVSRHPAGRITDGWAAWQRHRPWHSSVGCGSQRW